jgi:transcription-repair coupling factor (superfamily II helicase)
VDVLTMTATTIPRTLHMTLLGLRDISNLTTPPLDRRAIYTEVCAYSDERIRQAILRELGREGQVFFVHNRVQNIESVAEHIRTLVPDARVEIGHGQMPEGLLEKTMLRFVRGDIDVLVCTTIIESGLDIPTANTMFINEADRFGLAQLHQLRGRIGRYKHRAYCYLLLPQRRPVNRVAAKRLKAVEEFSDLGAGFQIAMRDLEIRGAGNILGSEQSGHIASVGYELYCRLLEQAVHQVRGDAMPPPPPEVHVELGLEAYIPRSYIESSRQRMEAYRRLALCGSIEELDQFEHDLADAYGKAPAIIQRLLMVARIRVLAGQVGIYRMILTPPDVIFSVADVKKAKEAFVGWAGTVRIPDAHTAHWRPPPAYLEQPTLLTMLHKQLQRAVKGK